MEQRPDFTYAGFWVRLLPEIIDSTILSGVAWLGEVGIFGLIYWTEVLFRRTGSPAVPPFSDAFNPLLVQAVEMVLYIIASFGYYGWGQFRWGTTPGKIAGPWITFHVGERWISRAKDKAPRYVYVVNYADFRPLTLRQSMIRCAAYALSYLPFCTGFIMAAFHPEKRALHDLVAGTISIRRKKRLSGMGFGMSEATLP